MDLDQLTDTQFHEALRQASRRGFLKAALYGVTGMLSAGLGATTYASRIEPEWLDLEQIQIAIPHLPSAFEGYRLVQLTDLHLASGVSYQTGRHAVQMALAADPDAIVLTGDYITQTIDPQALFETLRPLRARDGVWAVLGNHDHWSAAQGVRDVLAACGIGELCNTSTAIRHRTESLWLAGVDDIWERLHNLEAALAGIPPGAPVILLAHEPDYADEVYPTGRVSLMLSGHSHGGQVIIPGHGPVALPYLAHKYWSGAYHLGSMWLYVSRGVGTLNTIRINCRPEVTHITLTGA